MNVQISSCISLANKLVKEISKRKRFCNFHEKGGQTLAWSLENVYERNRKAPYTFYIPSEEIIDILSIGDMVKLIFVGETENEDCAGEKMWVEITHRNEGEFKGILTNEPYDLKDLKAGQEVSFQAKHICDTDCEDPDLPEWDYYFDTKVIVSNDVLDRREFNFMLRDYPNSEQDSGWSILSGYEEDSFLNNPDNLQCISIGVMLNIDDSILSFIDEQPLCAFERNHNGRFVKVDDYDWEGYLNG